MKLNVKNIRTDRRLSKAVRQAVGETNPHAKIEVVDGFGSPVIKGHSGYYTTKTGIRIRNRSAYIKSAPGAWVGIVHHPCCLTIEVGAGWLIEQGLV